MTKKEPNIKIFVSHHKPGYIYEDDIFVPIQVGKKNAKVDLGILGDDTGDNISEKNHNYAELTAQYWVWKNYDLNGVDYVGFCHYRRYMTYRYIPNIFNIMNNIDNFFSGINLLREHHYISNFNENILSYTSKDIKKVIKNSNKDIFLPKKFFNIFGFAYKDLCTDNEKAREIAISTLKLNPELYKIFLQHQYSKKYNLKNMFIMKTNLFKQYCNRLFEYLFLYENNLKKHHINPSELSHIKGDSRFLGIHAEILITIRSYMKIKEGVSVSNKANILYFK